MEALRKEQSITYVNKQLKDMADKLKEYPPVAGQEKKMKADMED